MNASKVACKLLVFSLLTGFLSFLGCDLKIHRCNLVGLNTAELLKYLHIQANHKLQNVTSQLNSFECSASQQPSQCGYVNMLEWFCLGSTSWFGGNDSGLG